MNSPDSVEHGGDTGAEDASVNFATGDYFRAMAIPILEGRAIESSDRAERPGVAAVNCAFVRRFFQGKALGRRIRI